MKKQTVWILPDNDKADNPVTWVDSASPQYTNKLKGPFIEAEATIFNDARTVEFDDDAYSDSNAGCNTKTIVLDKLADIKGCKTIMSIDGDKIIKKKQPHSYIFLKKPTFSGEGGDKSSETDALDSCTINFTIEGTQGVMSDGGSYSSSAVWKNYNGVNFSAVYFNRLSFFFIGPDGNIICTTDPNTGHPTKPVAFYVLLTKGHLGDVVNHGSTYFDDFSGCLSDATHTPAYKVSGAIYGDDEYKYSRYSNLAGADVSYTFNNNKHTVTFQATVHHNFPVGTKIVMGLGNASSMSSSNSSAFATPSEVESKFPFTPDYLSSRIEAFEDEYFGQSTRISSGIISTGEAENIKYSLNKINPGTKFFEPQFFSKSVSVNFVNPNKNNTMNITNGYPFDGGANAYYFPLGCYAATDKGYDLSEFTTYNNGLKPVVAGFSTYNTPAWTFLGDIRRYTRGGKPCMKGTIRYLDYMADLQPEGSEYQDYKPFEIGV